jgi:hypothetical protein
MQQDTFSRDAGLLEFLIASWAIFLRFQFAQVAFWLPWAIGRPLIWTPAVTSWLNVSSCIITGCLLIFSTPSLIIEYQAKPMS